MTDTESDATPKSHLGLRLAVGALGLAFLAVFIMLGSVAMKQSATTQALETREALRKDAQSATVRE